MRSDNVLLVDQGISDTNQNYQIKLSNTLNQFFLFWKVQDGLIYMFKGGKNLPSGNITDKCPLGSVLPCPQAHVKIV